MKRVWILAVILVSVLAATVAMAEARGPRGFGTAEADGTCLTGDCQAFAWQSGETDRQMGGPVMARRGGAVARGPKGGPVGGRMGGPMGGPGMMEGRNETICDGSNYDPAAMQEKAEASLARHQELLGALNARLDSATTDAARAALTARIERESIQLNWATGRLPVIAALPAEWKDGAISLAQYDISFFTGATAADERNQEWIAHRLERATQRLAKLQEAE